MDTIEHLTDGHDAGPDRRRPAGGRFEAGSVTPRLGRRPLERVLFALARRPGPSRAASHEYPAASRQEVAV
jgi:hypothetical protein